MPDDLVKGFASVQHTYEPGDENAYGPYPPQGPHYFPYVLNQYRQVADLARDRGIVLWAVPSGRYVPVVGDRARDKWDYAEIGKAIAPGRVIVQTQTFCRQGNHDRAVEEVNKQFRNAGLPRNWLPMTAVSLRGKPVINAVPATQSWDCVQGSESRGIHEHTHQWWNMQEAIKFLQLREQALPALPPPPPPALPIPGRIQAEDYKPGGEGVGYHDTTPGNSGGAYRSDDVDIQPTSDASGGHNIGWTRQGEWLAFNVQVAQAGYYDITARVASATAGTKSLHIEVDGVAVTGPMSFTDASGWQSWLDVKVPQVNLPAGPHELRIVLDTDFLNVNYLEVTPSPVTPKPLLLPGRIEAEEYKAGGEGVGYHDTSSGNSGGEYRSDDVDIQVATDAGGGYNIGWTRQGEWLAFDVQVAQSGHYDITARLASAVEGLKMLHVEVDGVDVTGPLSFTDASGWQSWLNAIATRVPLTAGTHELRIVMDSDFFNVNYLDVAPSVNQPPLSGDANQDGQFTGDDIYLVIDWVIGRQPMPQGGAPAFVAADVDSDGRITAQDVVLLIKRLTGG
jgi:hypothetical protein